MIITPKEFKYKIPVKERLISFGFKPLGEEYIYTREIMGGAFSVSLSIVGEECELTVTDNAAGEEYYPAYVSYAAGAFVGEVKESINQIIAEIAENCFVFDAFKQVQTKRIFEYVKEAHGICPEYTFEDSPDVAVLRDNITDKWYGIVMQVTNKALCLSDRGMSEVLNLKADPENVLRYVDGQNVLPAYHMNKKHWYTVVLDGRNSWDFISARIDESLECVRKKHRKKR